MNYVALSFDIEDWYHTASISGSSFSIYPELSDFLAEHNDRFIDCITSETIRILDILDSMKLRATFFVVADVAKRYSKLTEALKSTNHEIASHSLTHRSAIDSKSKIALQTEEDWRKDQQEAKIILEGIFKREISGFRAPNAFFANWMIPILSELGFKYDSSIAYNSLYNKTNVKLFNIPSKPYRVSSKDLSIENQNSTLVELPWSNLRICRFLNLPVGGAYFFRILGYNYFRFAINQALKHGDSMFYLHPLDITQKEIPLSNSKSRPLYWINKGYKAEANLIKLLSGFKKQIKPCIDVYNKFITEN